MTDLPDKQLGRYRLEELQGRGGMAKVYRAFDPNTQRYVAIKVLHQHLAEEEGFKERFEREGKLFASLNHPNIISLYDFDQTESAEGTVHYMVMPFIEGPTLSDIIADHNKREERLPMDQIVNIVNGIASALDYAHSKDMVHRDIKPGNILFDDRGNALLTDFGLARLTFGARLTQSGVASGTPAYMAPEQGLGEPGDRRSDTYAMGMILFEMVTGQLPFSADTSLALILKHINDPLPSPRTIVPDLAPAIEAIIYRATAKDPDDRYQTAGALATELRAATSGQEISSLTAMTASRQRRAARSYRRSSLGVMGAIIAVAAVVLIIGALSANPPGAPPDPTTTPTSVAVSAMTSRAIPVLTEFDPGDDFIDEWPESEGQLVRELVNGQYVLRSEIANQGYATVLSPDYYSYNSVRVETTATLNPDSQPSSGFGVIFRYHDNDNYYVFTINGNREVSIWIRDDGLWEELRGGASEWTRDDAVNPPGEPNLLTVEANGESFIGYVNQTPVVTVSDSRIASGSVGLYIATAIQTTLGRGEQALTEVAFDRFSADLFTPSMGTSGQ